MEGRLKGSNKLRGRITRRASRDRRKVIYRLKKLRLAQPEGVDNLPKRIRLEAKGRLYRVSSGPDFDRVLLG